MSQYRQYQPAEVCCHGKDQLSHDIAVMVAGKIRNGAASAYHCEHCGFWHVGSHVSRKRQGKGRKGRR